MERWTVGKDRATGGLGPARELGTRSTVDHDVRNDKWRGTEEIA